MFKKALGLLFLLFLIFPAFNVNAFEYVKIDDVNHSTGARYVYVPDNAYLNYKGDGYICNTGYVNKGNYCEKIKVPEHALFNKKYNYWFCEPGYKKEGNECKKIVIPENGRLNYDGTDFSCNSGYQKSNNSCVPISSNNIYFLREGTCPFGYKKTGYTCTQLFIPSTAHFTSDGHDFECNYGFSNA